MYEASTYSQTHMCSSILVLDKNNKVFHGRNLDFDFYRYLSKMVARVDVYKGN